MSREHPIANNNTTRSLPRLLHIAPLWGSSLIAVASPVAPEIRFENLFARTVATSHQMGGVNGIIQDDFGFIWIADLRPDDSFETAFNRADNALYRAKDLGRNCVILEP